MDEQVTFRPSGSLSIVGERLRGGASARSHRLRGQLSAATVNLLLNKNLADPMHAEMHMAVSLTLSIVLLGRL